MCQSPIYASPYVVAATISVLGLIFAALLNWWLQAKNRKLEIYKIAYPKRLDAALSIVNDAKAIYLDAVYKELGLARAAQPEVSQERLLVLMERTKADAILVGDGVVDAVGRFCKLTSGATVDELRVAYESIETEVRKSVHLDTFSRLVK